MNNIVRQPENLKPNRQKTPKLIADTWQALLPYIDPYSCAEKVLRDGNPHIQQMLPKYTAELYGRYRYNKSQNLNFKNGKQFTPSSYFAGIMTASKLYKMAKGEKTYYYRSNLRSLGRRKGIFALDHDAHFEFQNDHLEQRTAISKFLGAENVFDVGSDRGGHQHIKFDYGRYSISDRDRILKDFHVAISQWCRSQGFQSDIEIKGTTQPIKFPVRQGWSEVELRNFKISKEVTLDWVIEKTKEFIAETDLAKAERIERQVQRLKDGDTTIEAEEIIFQPTPKPKKKITSGGSFVPRPWSDEEIELAKHLLNDHEIKQRSYYLQAMRSGDPSGRRRISNLDWRKAWIVLCMLALKPNANHGNPNARVRYVYELLGWIFDASKWRVIRDTCVDCGFIEEIDRNYWFNDGENSGKGMQWELESKYNRMENVESELKMDQAERKEKEGEHYSVTDYLLYPVFLRFRWRPQQLPPPERDPETIKPLMRQQKNEIDEILRGLCVELGI